MTCDWLLETRTALWEYEQSKNVSDIYIPVSGSVMSKFQKDLNSLRSVTEEIPVSKTNKNNKKKNIKNKKISYRMQHLEFICMKLFIELWQGLLLVKHNNFWKEAKPIEI